MKKTFIIQIILVCLVIISALYIKNKEQRLSVSVMGGNGAEANFSNLTLSDLAERLYSAHNE